MDAWRAARFAARRILIGTHRVNLLASWLDKHQAVAATRRQVARTNLKLGLTAWMKLGLTAWTGIEVLGMERLCHTE